MVKNLSGIALAGVAQWIEHQPANQRIQVERALCTVAQWSRQGRVVPEKVNGVKVYF